MPEPGDITLLLQQADRGDAEAAQQLFLQVQDQLKAIARKRKRQTAAAVDVATTILVDEAFVRLVGKASTTWLPGDRKKFFGFIARKIEDILIDMARAESADKRPPGRKRVSLDFLGTAQAGNTGLNDREFMLDLKGALEQFDTFAPDDALLFRIHFFLGCTFAETAEALELSETGAKRGFERARLWLRRALRAYNHDA